MSSNQDILYCYRDKNQHRSYTASLCVAIRRHVGDTDITYMAYEPKKSNNKKNKNKKR